MAAAARLPSAHFDAGMMPPGPTYTQAPAVYVTPQGPGSPSPGAPGGRALPMNPSQPPVMSVGSGPCGAFPGSMGSGMTPLHLGSSVAPPTLGSCGTPVGLGAGGGPPGAMPGFNLGPSGPAAAGGYPPGGPSAQMPMAAPGPTTQAAVGPSFAAAPASPVTSQVTAVSTAVAKAGGLPTRSFVLRSLPRGSGPNGQVDDAEVAKEAQNIFDRIVKGESDTMSRLQFIRALVDDKTVASFVLPGIDGARLFEDEDAHEAAHHLFNDISRGRRRIRFNEFLANFQNSKTKASNATELREVFDLFDVNKDNRISRHELLLAVKRDQKVRDLMLRESEANLEEEEELSDAVDDVYKAICGDSKYFDFADFVGYFRSIAKLQACALHQPIIRSEKRVLIIGPGFGAQLNPAQTQAVMQGGFQVHWVHGIPNPEEAEFDMLRHVSTVKEAINNTRPDLLMCGSKGGGYVVACWKMGFWRGPTLMINAHPQCQELPADLPIVITHGDQDPVYPRPRAELEALIATGSPNMCFLYYSSTSGRLASGHTPRMGDQHNMASLIPFETLPRLMESALSPEGPELHMMRTWLERLHPQRVEAEKHLGYTPQKMKQFWISPKRLSATMARSDNGNLYDVPAQSLEAQLVSTVFTAQAKDPSTYGSVPSLRIVRIQRIENAGQEDAGVIPYYNSVRGSCESMGVEFVPGVHTRWLFHGSSAIDSIISNPIQGFQPLASGTQGEAVWGKGTYFARDASYVAAGPFCGARAPDGTRRMLVCLVTTGMSCAGDPANFGVLPVRRAPHRYNSSVDSLSSPEIFIIQHPGAAYPAYVVTFLG
mmetsp:Transcript_61334/g.154829  ORF Transcript_61334/g.154829 Transcript_61334/m.154829 type:complete len:824 (+) Transcript_61334:130-2601(+)